MKVLNSFFHSSLSHNERFSARRWNRDQMAGWRTEQKCFSSLATCRRGVRLLEGLLLPSLRQQLMNNTVSRRAQTAAGVTSASQRCRVPIRARYLGPTVTGEKGSVCISSCRALPSLFSFVPLPPSSLCDCTCTSACADTHLSFDIFPLNC